MKEAVLKQLENELVEVLRVSMEKRKKSVFCIASTRNISTPNYYFTTRRESERSISTCLMVQDMELLTDILDKVDGRVDIVLYDSEAKFEGLSALGERVRKEVKTSKVIGFLGNKMSSDAVSAFFQLSGLAGTQVLLFGAGKLGTRVTQDLVEFGCHVDQYRRNENLALKQADAVNSLKSSYSPGGSAPVSSKDLNFEKYDVLLSCSNEPGCLTKEMVSKTSKSCTFIDVGLGSFSDDALKVIYSRGKVVYMTNIGESYARNLDFLLETAEDLESPDSAQIDGVSVFKKGLLAPLGGVVVDNVLAPSVIYGVSKGNGLLLNEEEKVAFREKLRRVQDAIDTGKN